LHIGSGQILVAGRIEDRNTLVPEIAYLGSKSENQIIGTVVEDEVLFGLQLTLSPCWTLKAKKNVCSY